MEHDEQLSLRFDLPEPPSDVSSRPTDPGRAVFLVNRQSAVVVALSREVQRHSSSTGGDIELLDRVLRRAKLF